MTTRLPNLRRIWGAVCRRWHANADWRLRESGDDTASHSGRACALAAVLFPDHPRVCQYLALHDLGEGESGQGPGDVSSEAKRLNPDLKDMVHDIEIAALARLGIVMPCLTDEEAIMAVICDRLDAWLLCRDRAPDRVYDADWIAMRRGIIGHAEGLGRADVLDAVVGAMILRNEGDSLAR